VRYRIGTEIGKDRKANHERQLKKEKKVIRAGAKRQKEKEETEPEGATTRDHTQDHKRARARTTSPQRPERQGRQKTLDTGNARRIIYAKGVRAMTMLLKVGDLTIRLRGKGSLDIEITPHGVAIITVLQEPETLPESENGKRATTTAATTTTNGNGKPQEAKEEKTKATTNGKGENRATTNGNHNHNGNGKGATTNGKKEEEEEKATEKQLRTIYAICRKNGIDWHPIIQRMFGKESSKQLTKKEASELIDYLQTLETFRDF